MAIIRPGGSQQWDAELGKLRICSLAAGKLKVKVGEQYFSIGPNGMFKIGPGMAAVVENWLYVDAVLHIFVVDC